MSNFEAQHRPLNPNKLKPLPRLMLALVVVALGACQKPSPPITALVPSTGIVLTFIPTDKGVRAYEFPADQPNKIMLDINVGDVVNAFEQINNENLDPLAAAFCADDITNKNRSNLQPEPADSKISSSARKVLLPEGGLIIPDTCGNLKNNSTPTASSAPMQTQTSVPIATPQTQGTEALINNGNMGVVFGTLCASILGIGAMLFGGLRALRRRKGTPVVLTRISTEEESQVPTVIPLPGNVILSEVMIDGKRQRILQDPAFIVMERDPATLKEARRLLERTLKEGHGSRAKIAKLADHEVKHMNKAPEDVSNVHVVRNLRNQKIGASVIPLNPNLTAEEIRTFVDAPGKDRMSEHDKRIHDHADKLAQRLAKKK